MKRKIFLVAVIALSGAGAAYWWSNHEHGSNAARLVLYGNVDIRQVELAFNGSERIDHMLFHEGDKVKKGQLLATLDTGRLAKTVDLQRAQLAAQQQVVAR